MDYVEAFKNLKTNNKYSRKSPHKAILLLTIIEMYETNVLLDNVIYYDDLLKDTFLKVWNRTLKDESIFHPGAYLPFWFMQSEDFWHIVPNRGKEGILALMRDSHVKPSESKIVECVKYAELDADLYFLMTLQSGRSSLKRVLLENYTYLLSEEVDRLSSSVDNAVDYSVSAMTEYENIVAKKKDNQSERISNIDNIIMSQFLELNDDVQIVLNLEYYSYLKKYKDKRTLYKELFPTVYDLFDHIVNKPLRREELPIALAASYENFLSDLRISLMSIDDSMCLIDKINESLETLRNDTRANKTDEIDHYEKPYTTEYPNIDDTSKVDEYLDKDGSSETRRGKTWTKEEEDFLTHSFKQGKDYSTIAIELDRTEVAIKSRLAKLGLINYVYGEDDDTSFKIENFPQSCTILNKQGEKVFSSEGKLKYINGKLYRLNLKKECFTIKSMQLENGMWTKGDKKIVAYPQAKLYSLVNRMYDYTQDIEDIEDSSDFKKCRIKFKGEWYNNDGIPIESKTVVNHKTENLDNKIEVDIDHSQFSVKIGDVLKLFPSQLVGEVVKLRIDKSGRKKIIVQSSDGPRVEIYDSKFLYQKVFETKNDLKSSISGSKPSLSEQKDVIYEEATSENTSDSQNTRNHSNIKKSKIGGVKVGNWIKSNYFLDKCKVIRIESIGPTLEKLIVEFKDGRQDWVIDNPDIYRIVEE